MSLGAKYYCDKSEHITKTLNEFRADELEKKNNNNTNLQ